jgi:hypothetical protein
MAGNINFTVSCDVTPFCLVGIRFSTLKMEAAHSFKMLVPIWKSNINVMNGSYVNCM